MPRDNQCERNSDYPVLITIFNDKGKCSQGFKKGDYWLIEKNITPTNFCMNAFCQSVYHTVRTFRYGGSHRWDKDKDITYVECPDHGKIVFKVERLPLE
jgi:uncharacterized repeat protein (TIGR04076 family)